MLTRRDSGYHKQFQIAARKPLFLGDYPHVRWVCLLTSKLVTRYPSPLILPDLREKQKTAYF